MTNLQIINTNDFNGISCDIYSDGSRIFMTRTQIGKALDYGNPQKAIDNIHAKHSNRLEPLSVTLKVRGTDGKMYNTYLYNQRGIMEICRWSRQPIADKFMDWVWDIIEAYRDGTLIPSQSKQIPTALTDEYIIQMIDDKFSQLKSELQEELKSIQQPTLSITTTTKATVQSPEDIIRETIEPLAKLLNDNSKGYNCTFRKVYSAMDVSWSHRQSRYKNKHNNKNKPSKLKLITEDSKLLKMFISTVDDMILSKN